MASIVKSATPAARLLFVTSVVARLPVAMLSIGILVHVEQLTRSFANAGVVTAAYGIGVGVGGPLFGRVVDRHGPTAVLLATAACSFALLVALALTPSSTAFVLLILLAAGTGVATPPVDACLRSQLPDLVSEPAALRSAYALEATVMELTYIAGPPLAICIGELWSSGAALAAGGSFLFAATLVFAVQPSSRHWRSISSDARRRGGSLRTSSMQTLVIILFAVGALLGADEVGVIAAAKSLHETFAAAPLFAVWGAGSFVGGLLMVRQGGGARTFAGLIGLLAALVVGHVALVFGDRSVLVLGAMLFVAGATISPTEATVYAMVDQAAPSGTITEAFAWLVTAMTVGGAIGAAAGGVAAQHRATAAFVLGAGAGLCAVGVSIVRSNSLAVDPYGSSVGP